MAKRIKYPLPWDLGDAFKRALGPAWQRRWAQRTKPARKTSAEVDEAWKNTGGFQWCDANKTASEFWEEQASAGDIAEILKALRGYNQKVEEEQHPEGKVDFQETDHETFREPVLALLKACLQARKLVLRVKLKPEDDAPMVLMDNSLELAADGVYCNSMVRVPDDALAAWSIREAEPARVVYNLTEGHPDLYKLVLRLFYPFYAVSIHRPLAQLWEPWATWFPKIRPIVKPAGQQAQPLYFWGWRSDGRPPDVVFREGFFPKFTSKGDLALWDTLTEACREIRDNVDDALTARPRRPQDPAPAKSANRVWFRYNQQDLCLSGSVAVATCFAGAVVFPKVPPSQPQNVKPVRRGEKGNPVDEHPKDRYVYAIRKPVDHVHDIGHVQHLVSLAHRGAGAREPWAEVAMSEVKADEILFALKVRRWPKDLGGGWFRVLEVCRRQDQGECGDWLNIDTPGTRVELERDWPHLYACLQHYLLPSGRAQDDFQYLWTTRCGVVHVGDIHNPVGCAGEHGTAHATDLPPEPPARLTAQVTQDGRGIELRWHAAGGATSYKIKRSAVQGHGYADIGTDPRPPAVVPLLNYGDPPPERGIRYYYVVIASNADTDSVNSNEVNAMLPPLAPTGLHANPRRNRVVLSWNVSNGARSYTVKRKTGNEPYAPIQTGVTHIPYTDEQLANGTTYSYVVTAVNEGGESPASNDDSATPRCWKLW